MRLPVLTRILSVFHMKFSLTRGSHLTSAQHTCLFQFQSTQVGPTCFVQIQMVLHIFFLIINIYYLNHYSTLTFKRPIIIHNFSYIQSFSIIKNIIFQSKKFNTQTQFQKEF